MKKFLSFIIIASLALPCTAGSIPAGSGSCATSGNCTAAENRTEHLLNLINLDYPGLEKVKSCAEAARWDDAAVALLEYFRTRPDVKIPEFPVKGQKKLCSKIEMERADLALEHTFYAYDSLPPENYGKEKIDWTYWPVKDVEVRVGIHRHRFFTCLAKAYGATGDEKYAQAYVDIMRDWMKNNPYEPFDSSQQGGVSSGDIDVNAPNVYFVWRPLEITSRLNSHSLHLEYLKHSKAFTPEFLVEFLSEYIFETEILDREWTPFGNHRIHEAIGILRASIAFPEFKYALRWRTIGIAILNEGLAMQVFPDGCHYEYCPAYHSGSMMGNYINVLVTLDANGMLDCMSPYSKEMIRKMLRYTLAFTYPDLRWENFSDARNNGSVKAYFQKAARFFPDDEVIQWFASDGARGKAPEHPSIGYPDTGFYNLKSGWGGNDVSMAIKATRRGAWHAQPDFGTFGLWVAGRRLIQDASCYAYSGDEHNLKWRAYFKQTARHSTLTLNDRDYLDPDPQVICWDNEGESQLLSIRHKAYEGLVHRRSIAFDGVGCYVIVDEVNGDASGRLNVRYTCGTNPATIGNATAGEVDQASGKNSNDAQRLAGYRDGNAGFVLASTGMDGNSVQNPTVKIVRDWLSPTYLQKMERDVITLEMERKPQSGTQRFISILCTYTDGQAPVVENISASVRKGALNVRFKVSGKTKTVRIPSVCS